MTSLKLRYLAGWLIFQGVALGVVFVALLGAPSWLIPLMAGLGVGSAAVALIAWKLGEADLKQRGIRW